MDLSGASRNSVQKRNPLSHSANSALLTPSHHRTVTTKIWQLSGDPSDPPIPIREIREESRQVQESFLAKQPKTPPPPPPPPAGIPEQQDDCRLNLEQHQSGGYRGPKWLNSSRVRVNYKEPDSSTERCGQTGL